MAHCQGAFYISIRRLPDCLWLLKTETSNLLSFVQISSITVFMRGGWLYANALVFNMSRAIICSDDVLFVLDIIHDIIH